MNAVGRPVIEASLSKKPAIIALKNYNNDTAKKNNCLNISNQVTYIFIRKKNIIFYKK
jgi:hypothetical protein